MTPRLPGKCCKCSAKVEARLHPVGWCDEKSDVLHVCVSTRKRRKRVVRFARKEVGRALRKQPRPVANPERTGVSDAR